MRLFDQTKNLIYLDGMSDYIITSSPKAIAIACVSGDKICFGGQDAQATPTPAPTPNPTPHVLLVVGVGLNNDRTCSDCCFTCASVTVPPITLVCP